MVVRHRTPSQEVEPAILAAAEALLDEGGPEALSVRRIAERACVAPMGLYSRFDGKQGVVDALFTEGFAALASTIRSTRENPDAVGAFRDAGLAYRALAKAHPARYQVMFLRAVPGFEPSEPARLAAGDAFLALVEALQRGIDAGGFSRGDAAELAQQVWATCHGWVALELCGINFVEDLDAGYGRLLDLVLRGLSTG